MTPNGNRQKGANAERELARLLEGWAFLKGISISMTRNLDQTRAGGHDLVGLEEFGLAFEVKRQEQPFSKAWWEQACRQAKAVDCVPVLAYRQSRKPWSFMVTIPVGNTYRPVTMTEDVFYEWFTSYIVMNAPKL